MNTLHFVSVRKEPTTKLWVIEHQTTQKPKSGFSTVTKQRIFLSKTGLRAVRDKINEVLP